MPAEKPKATCFLCNKESNGLEGHHLIPKFLTEFYPYFAGKGGTIPLCPHCHEKLHFLLEHIRMALKYEIEEEGKN